MMILFYLFFISLIGFSLIYKKKKYLPCNKAIIFSLFWSRRKKYNSVTNNKLPNHQENNLQLLVTISTCRIVSPHKSLGLFWKDFKVCVISQLNLIGHNLQLIRIKSIKTTRLVFSIINWKFFLKRLFNFTSTIRVKLFCCKWIK